MTAWETVEVGGVQSHWAQKSQFINLTICRRSFISEWSSAAKTKTNVGGGIKSKISQLSTVCASRERDGESWKIWKSCHYNRIKDIGRDCTNEERKSWKCEMWDFEIYFIFDFHNPCRRCCCCCHNAAPRDFIAVVKNLQPSVRVIFHFSLYDLWCFSLFIFIIFHPTWARKRVPPSTRRRVLGSTLHVNGEKHRASGRATRFYGIFLNL